MEVLMESLYEPRNELQPESLEIIMEESLEGLLQDFLKKKKSLDTGRIFRRFSKEITV